MTITNTSVHRGGPSGTTTRTGSAPRRTNGAVIVALVIASLLIVGETARSRGEDGLATEVQGDSTRVSLDRIIDSDRLAKRKNKLLRWLVDQQAGAIMLRPFAAAWDGDSLLVTDPGARRVLRIDRRDRVKLSSADTLVSPMGIANCAAGILVTDSATGELLALDRDLKLLGTIASGMRRPTGVVCHDERIIVAETGRHRLVVIDDMNGAATDPVLIDEQSESWGVRGGGDGELNFPTAVAAQGDRVWVGDTLNFRVQLLNMLRGEFVAAFGQIGDSPGEMPRIKGLAVDSIGNLWISDAHLDQVALYRSDGVFLTSVGSSGDMPGQFSFPAGIAAHDDGRVAIVDSLNRRIQVFRVSGSAGEKAN